MSDQHNPTNDENLENDKVNADTDNEITDEQLDQVAGGKVDMVDPTAVELPQGGSLSQGLNIKKPGGFLPLE